MPIKGNGLLRQWRERKIRRKCFFVGGEAILKITDVVFRYLEKLSTAQLVIAGAGLVTLMVTLVVLGLSASDDEGVVVSDTGSAMMVGTVKVVVAKHDILARGKIDASMLKEVDVPESLVPAGALRAIEDVNGKFAAHLIAEGEVLTPRKLINNEKEAGFIGMIPPDMRAVSIPVDDIGGVSGFARPGDHVDIVMVHDGGRQQAVGEILLQDVLLLAVNKTATPEKVGGQPMEDDKRKDDESMTAEGMASNAIHAPMEATMMATLALHPEKALRLLAEMRNDKVYLMLRPFKPKNALVLDTEYVSKRRVQDLPLPTPSAPPPYPAAGREAPPMPSGLPNNYGIEVIRGTARS